MWSLLFLIISVSCDFDNYDCNWNVYTHGDSFWIANLGFLKLGNFGSAFAQVPWCFCPRAFF